VASGSGPSPYPRGPSERGAPLRSVRRLGTAALVAAVLVACSGEETLEFETAAVEAGEVVQTVAAAAQLEPAARVTVTASAGGEVAELLVADGDEVAEGDPLVRVTSGSVELQIAQAQAAVDAADALAGAAAGAGVDLSPVLGAFRGQLDAVFPPLIEALDQQAAAIENEDARAAVQERIDRADAAYRQARANLQRSEAEARGQAQQATAGQVAAAEAQREQAALALDAARDRAEDLTVVAPAAGVVELARTGDGGGGGLPDLEGLGGGGLGGDGAAGGEDLGALLGGAGGGGSAAAGPLAAGVAVTPGQSLLTIYDLSGFTAMVEVDEIDVVEVEEGQAVTVLVDAFPASELRGVVDHVALAPRRGVTGGASYPVTVDLRGVPAEVRLRVGLTASAEIEVRRVESDTVVPTSALLRRGGGEVVHVVRAGIAREIPVTVTAIGEETAAVEGELEPGERVVTVGVELIEDGDEVPA
jgi:HlyD family secretion protein